MQTEDIIRLKNANSDSEMKESEARQKSLHKELINALNLRMITPSRRVCELLVNLINIVKSK